MDYPKMLVVYVAGKYNDTNVIDVGRNIREGKWMAIKLMSLGFAPYCPFLDFDYLSLVHVDAETLKKVGMEMLRRSDALFILSSWEHSPGTQEEIIEAKNLNIPIFSDVFMLLDWRGKEEMAREVK